MGKSARFLPSVLIFIYLIPTLFPFYWMLKSALGSAADVYKPSLLPSSMSLANFASLLGSTNFLTSAGNSLRVALGAGFIVMACSALGGYALARMKFKHKAVIAQIVLFSYMFPEILLGIPFFAMFQKAGLLNSLSGLTLAHVTLSLPFGLWLMWQFFQSLPPSYEEAAQIDGASKFQTFFRIMLPLSLPALAAVFIFGFAASWNDYVLGLMLIRDDKMFTLPIAMSLFVQQMDLNWAVIQAANILLALPGLLLVLFGQKYLVRGFQTSGLAN
ncbi:MAG: binding-protein-dependent transport system inner rane component [Polaromonas sp.]|nr:binding-protein-dependent transport system inner rane component [Polaromonas sp.]